MLDFFRIRRGLVLDDQVSILHGSGAPGIIPGTDADLAKVGSLYLDTTNGDLHIKATSGFGPVPWNITASTSGLTKLYNETAGTIIPSSPAGTNSITLGNGASTSLAAYNSLAIGEQSLARHPGSVVLANGRFSTTGDAQVGKYLLRGTTVNGSETELFIDGTGLGGGTERLVMPDDATWTFKATITGHRTDMSDGHAGFEISGVVYRINGANTIALAGKPTITIISKVNRQWDVQCYADILTGALKFTVTGQPLKTIRWLACVDTVEITN
jgi:hypothetical protein